MSVSRYSCIIIFLIFLMSCSKVKHEDKITSVFKLHEIMERGNLRVVTNFNSISYFIYRGQPMGYQYELLQELANQLGVKLQVTVNNNLNEQFKLLSENKVDLIAANITVTKERRAQVEFTQPHTQSRQVLVQYNDSPWKSKSSSNTNTDGLISDLLQLGGKTIYVEKNSPYAQRLKNISDEIGDTIYIVEVDEDAEQLIEKVSKGEIKYTIADENLANVERLYYNNIDISVPVSFPQNMAWALDKGANDLKIAIDDWLTSFKKTKRYALIYRKYYQNEKAAHILEHDFFTTSSDKISPYDALIKENSLTLGWDWRLVASLIYQESRFNPQAKSWAGAYGLMQLMPSTAERFGMTQSAPPKQQIHAGIMFLQWLDEKFEEVPDSTERIKFVLASYNIGMGHVLDARALALKNGKDPNKWDNHVDQFLLNKAFPKYYNDPVVKHGYCRGIETYRYVADIMERYGHYKNLITE